MVDYFEEKFNRHPIHGYYKEDYQSLWPKLPEKLPVLPLRRGAIFPGAVVNVSITREYSYKLLENAYSRNKFIAVIPQLDESIASPNIEELYKIGTAAKVIQFAKLSNNTALAVLWGIKSFEVAERQKQKDFLYVKVNYFEEIIEDENELKTIAEEILNLIEALKIYVFNINKEIVKVIYTQFGAKALINILANHIDTTREKYFELLSAKILEYRAHIILEIIENKLQQEQVRSEIEEKIKVNIEKQQKEYILHQHLKAIQEELEKLGTKSANFNKEIAELQKRAEKKKWPEKVRQVFEKELSRLAHIPPVSPEYGIQITYLETLLDLPWDEKTKDIYDIKRAKEILDKDHYGLEKVKDRILEYLAVLQLSKGNLKSPILCLYGPPGVGKTSLGRSIAKALNRKFVRMSLGGLHDESEIRGHRKTYVGAMPGRIIQNIRRAKVSNPVFMLDEIDKIGHDYRGDPASALLEVLDPEQNHTFYDNYLEIEYDLSDVLFIATANTLSTIHPALLDRMEVIEMTGYLLEEKIEIAKRHLIPKQKEAHGMKRRKIEIPDKSLQFLIENYTRESGVRELEKKIAAIIRKRAKDIVFKRKNPAIITPERIVEYLGAPKYLKYSYEVPKVAGVVPGLAWTQAGGEILMIEASASRGSGKLSMTGNLGDIMKESAQIAYQYIKSHYADLNLHPLLFKFWDVHLHVPEGAIPKDGPSAGITITTALASLFTQRKIKPFLAMTGEITLTGKVLPVGGIKEKILAAKRAGIKEIILSQKNKPDIEEIKEIYREGLSFHFVETIEQVLQIALLKEKVDKPIKIGIPKKILKQLYSEK